MSHVRAGQAFKSIDPDKVAMYIRWSTEDQGDGTTLEVQMEGCKHYALSQGWNANEDLIHIDEGYSGGSLDRPAMTRLRKAVQDGKIDCVIVFKLDRLSRSVVDTVNLVLEEWDDLCHVKSAREPIDTTNHAGKMFFYMLVSYAEWERNVIRERTWSGRLKRAQEGRNPGFNAPYGYRVGETPGTLEIIPSEAQIVRRMYQMYLDGIGMRSVLNTLHTEGIPFRDRILWNESTIRHILTNSVYKGDLVWGIRMTNPRHGKREGEKQRIYSDEPLAFKAGAFPAIIEPKVWDRAQVVRESRPGRREGTSGRAVSSRFLLTGLALCKCGSAIIGREGAGRGTHLYYICSGKNSKGQAHCDCGYINKEKADEAAVTELRRLYGTKAKREGLLRVMKSELQLKLERLLPALHLAEKDLGKFTEQDRELRQQYREKQLTLQEFRDFKADLDEDMTSVTQRRASLAQQADETRRALLNHDQWDAIIARIDEWESLTVPQQKSLLRTICKSMTLYRKPRGSEILLDAVWIHP
jgi:site-specific DNA recombinase